MAAAGVAGAAAVLVRRARGEVVTSPSWIAGRYDRLAPVYDTLAAPYQWIGGRRLAGDAIDALCLAPGDTVVALGCGTGWSLPALVEQVGPTGHVIGVDLSRGMLRRARSRVDRAGVSGRVELVEADMRQVGLPDDTAGVLAAFSAEMVTDHDALVAHLVSQLRGGARIAFCGLREPEDGWPEWMLRLGRELNRVFGVRELHRDLTPWRAVIGQLDDTSYREDLGGVVYLAAGTVMPARRAG